MKKDPHFRIAKWFPDLAPATVELLRKFHAELVKFNKAINLVSARSIDEADATHFADSILGAQLVSNDTKADEIYDFGSGNGFPGIVLAIVCPQIKVTMVESDRRKSEFLKHSIARLGLSNATVLTARVESIRDEAVSAAVCRGFANLSKTLLMARRIMKVGGKLYSFKGPEWSYEIASMPEQICSTWNTQLLGEYKIPETDIGHCVVVASKTK